MLLTIKYVFVNIILDYIIAVIKGDCCDVGFLFQVEVCGRRFILPSLQLTCKGNCNASYFGHMGRNMKMININDTVRWPAH